MPEKELDKLIEVVRQAFTAAEGITLAEAIGALELIKMDLYSDATQEDSIKEDNV